jgi:hypothetical protein
MAIKKSKFKPGDTVFAKSPQTDNQTVIITLIKFIPSDDWFAECKDPNTDEVKKDYFKEGAFD